MAAVWISFGVAFIVTLCAPMLWDTVMEIRWQKAHRPSGKTAQPRVDTEALAAWLNERD